MNGIYFLGTIEEKEKSDMENLNERKNSLIELKKIVDLQNQSSLLRNINEDLDEIHNSINRWWRDISARYKWEYDNTDEFLVDFNENNVFLKKMINNIFYKMFL